jgi:hypothetical protein
LQAVALVHRIGDGANDLIAKFPCHPGLLWLIGLRTTAAAIRLIKSHGSCHVQGVMESANRGFLPVIV